MAKDITPAGWITSWAEDGTTVSFPIASITSLTAVKADGTTGDIRAAMKDILEDLFQTQDGTTAADQLDSMVISKSEAINADGSLQTSYGFKFLSDISAATTIVAEA